MTVMRAVWIILLASFASLNAWALASAGWDGVVAYFTSMGPIDVVTAVDLVLALLVGIVFIARNARERSVDSRPFVLLTLLTGSIGLLGYLARHGVDEPTDASAGRLR